MTGFDLGDYAAGCGVAVPAEFAARCELLRKLLTEANQKHNLTRITAPADFAVKHVADSLSIVRCFPELADTALAVADIGCGAGFPSLVLALAFPQLRVTAIDSTAKKTAFVAAAGRELGLGNLAVVTGRSRELDRRPEFRGKFDLVTARAVADFGTVVSDARGFVRGGGRFILYKTPEQLAIELAERPALEKKLRLEITALPPFELPCNGGSRQFLLARPR